jgi:hypothetical protein
MQKYDHHPNRKVGEHWRNITARRAIDCTGTEICRGRTGFPQPDRDDSLEHLFARRPALIKQIAEKRPLRENNCTSPRFKRNRPTPIEFNFILPVVARWEGFNRFAIHRRDDK